MPAAGVFVGQQPRKTFGLSYRTRIGNDLEGDAYGYKLHLVYGCIASPSEKAYNTINDSPEAITFSWELSTTPVPVSGFNPTALVVVDSGIVDAGALAALEAILYGDETEDATLPLPDEVIAIFGGGLADTATAGTPGTWEPTGSTPPASVSALQTADPAIVASPNTAWTTGQYVQTATAGVGGQAHWNGTAWTASPAP
ncbi:MAG: hypothetical protein ABWY25_07390 [Paenisporosarcina sp.]